MEFDPKLIENQKKKHQKITQIQQKSPLDRHLGPARAPGGPKSLKKRSEVKFWGLENHKKVKKIKSKNQ